MRNGDPAATRTLRWARKAIVLVFGGSVLAIGITLVVLPGPAIVVIPLGLAILATEFLWARSLLNKLREQAATMLRHRGPKVPPAGASDAKLSD